MSNRFRSISCFSLIQQGTSLLQNWLSVFFQWKLQSSIIPLFLAFKYYVIATKTYNLWWRWRNWFFFNWFSCNGTFQYFALNKWTISIPPDSLFRNLYFISRLTNVSRCTGTPTGKNCLFGTTSPARTSCPTSAKSRLSYVIVSSKKLECFINELKYSYFCEYL